MALTGITRVLECEKALLSLNDLQHDRVLISKSVAWEPGWLDVRARYVPDIHGGLKQWLAQDPAEDTPFVASREFSANDFEASPYAQNCLKPIDIVDVAHFFLICTPEQISEIVLFRQDRQGIITDREIELGRLLLPHLRRALAISKLLEIKTVAAASLATVLDTLAAAVVLVGADMRILHANRACETMLSLGTPISASSGMLKVRSPGAATALKIAVSQAVSNESAIGRKGLDIPVRCVGGEAWVLHVLPLQQGELRSGLMPGAVAAIFAATAASRPVSANATFAVLFGLTDAEAAVLNSIVSGRTTAEAAQTLDISIATVKTHLQHLFDKTGVRRQADLVALVQSFSLPLES